MHQHANSRDNHNATFESNTNQVRSLSSWQILSNGVQGDSVLDDVSRVYW